MKKDLLLESDSESSVSSKEETAKPKKKSQSSDLRLKINEKFAQQFEQKERQRELYRAKELLKSHTGSGSEESESSSESESEDDDAELLDPHLDLQIMKTLNSLKKKDPKIYDKQCKWFDSPNESDSDNGSESGNDASTKKKKFKDVLREQLLAGEAGENIELSDKTVAPTQSRQHLAYDAEQERIRQDFLKLASKSDKKQEKNKTKDAKGSTSNGLNGDNNNDDDGDDILLVKSKSVAELAAEEEELQKAIREFKELNSKSNVDESSKFAHHGTKVLDADEEPEKYLTTYLENRLWKQNPSGRSGERNDESDGDDDEEEVEEMERFESKYNFRFEELEDAKQRQDGSDNDMDSSLPMTEVMGHARQVQGSLRRLDDKRKQQREARKERKEREKRQQEAELKRLKNLKRQELKERLKQIGKMSGLYSAEDDADLEEIMRIKADFLDEDWDPEKHEALMAEQFGDDYYEQLDDNLNVVDFDNVTEYEKYLQQEASLGGDIDDYDVGQSQFNTVDHEVSTADNKKLSKREMKKLQKAQKSKDTEDNENQEMQSTSLLQAAKEMQDELYQLDYEDIVAGMPCRFKYRQVEKEDYGLSVEDILYADDTELNRYVSLKKLAAYKDNKSGSKGYGKDEDLSLSKKRKRLRAAVKERMAAEAAAAQAAGAQLKGTPHLKAQKSDAEEEVVDDSAAVDGSRKRKRKRRKGTSSDNHDQDDSNGQVEDNHYEAEGTVPESEIAVENSSSRPHKSGKKSKKSSSSKKEPTPQQQRMSLYR